MDGIDLDDFYSSGYFLIRANHPGWEQLRTELLPDKLVSLSSCISPRLEVCWGWGADSAPLVLDFGIPQEKLEAFTAWCQGAYADDANMWGMFFSTDGARRFARQFLPGAPDVMLIGAGLSKESPGINPRQPPEGEQFGIEQWIEKQLSLEQGGAPLGFEVVSFSYGTFGHSWLCSGLEQDMHRLFGIRPNHRGLIGTYAEARKVCAWIAEDEMQGRRAEPEPYDVWLLAAYPLDDPLPGAIR